MKQYFFATDKGTIFSIWANDKKTAHQEAVKKIKESINPSDKQQIR